MNRRLATRLKNGMLHTCLALALALFTPNATSSAHTRPVIPAAQHRTATHLAAARSALS